MYPHCYGCGSQFNPICHPEVIVFIEEGKLLIRLCSNCAPNLIVLPKLETNSDT